MRVWSRRDISPRAGSRCILTGEHAGCCCGPSHRWPERRSKSEAPRSPVTRQLSAQCWSAGWSETWSVDPTQTQQSVGQWEWGYCWQCRDRLRPCQQLLHQQNRQPAHRCDFYNDTTKLYVRENRVLCIRISHHNYPPFSTSPATMALRLQYRKHARADIQAETHANICTVVTVHSVRTQGQICIILNSFVLTVMMWHCAVAWVSGLMCLKSPSSL